MKARSYRFRGICIGGILALCAAWLSDLAMAQHSFASYEDVRQVLDSLTDILPQELRSSDAAARRRNWPDWVARHDKEIRARLLRGDKDTIVNWLLLGTSFTRQPPALIDVFPMPDDRRRLVSMRIGDLISALASPGTDERRAFARQLLLSLGHSFAAGEERARIERHLQAEVGRVIGEQQQHTATLNAALRTADSAEMLTVESRLFQDRGLSLDTSILPGFAVEKALEAMSKQKLLSSNSVRRVAIIGPGLDFADKNSGYDFYPVQTLQPFSSIDSLAKLGLGKPAELEVTAFDISPRVNEHILALRNRARAGAGPAVRLPLDPGFPWTPDLVSYWKSLGARIASETPVQGLPASGKTIEVRGVEVRAQVATTVTPIDFNVLTQRWAGPPFDLVIATNVLVYYDRFDQALAFAGIEAMLKPGGFFVTNNPVVELRVSRLRSIGFVPVQYSSAEPLRIDHVFWYRRNE